MSHFQKVKARFELESLKITLDQMGIEYELHLDEPQLLETRWSDRNEPIRAHVVITQQALKRRAQQQDPERVHSCRADIGFVRDEQGFYNAVIDEYECRGINEGFGRQLAQNYIPVHLNRVAPGLGFEVSRVERGKVVLQRQRAQVRR